MRPVDAVRLGKWLQQYDPGFFGYVAQTLALQNQLSGLGGDEAVATITAAGSTTTAAPALSIWDKIQNNAAQFASTVTSLANTYYGYKTQKAVVQAAAKQAQAAAPITAANQVPALVPSSVKSTKAVIDELWPYLAAAGLFVVTVIALKGGTAKTAAPRMATKKGR